jgi:hypothetical protein
MLGEKMREWNVVLRESMKSPVNNRNGSEMGELGCAPPMMNVPKKQAAAKLVAPIQRRATI